MQVYSPMIVLIVNILRVLMLKKVMDRFLCIEETDEKPLKIGFGIYCLMTTVIYCFLQVSVTFEVCNCLGIIALTVFYQDNWKKRLWIAFMLFCLDMTCSLAVLFIFGKEGEIQQSAIQVLLLLICVTMISHISYPEEKKKMVFDKRQTLLLLVTPVMSVVILSMLMLGKLGRIYAFVICSSIIIINISVFYLYDILLENYMHLRENEIYKQQTYAYQNQLEVIMESRNRIRALRHDMKNHILALRVLVKQNKPEEAERYLDSMLNFMKNPQEYVTTGNDSVDSLLNYKIQKAKEILRVVETEITIPERLKLHSFDLNVILGNLLDNAIEASGQTDEKKLKITMRLDRGILFLNICNSCRGLAPGKRNVLETTKADKINHGIGLKNVRRIVENYHGDMELVCENDFMEADIMMYYKDM